MTASAKEPFRLKVDGGCATPLEKWKENAAINARHPHVERRQLHRKLAVVGGGPSVIAHLDELRAWDGDIWAVNKTAEWLTERGIACTMFTVDAVPFSPGVVRDAVVATVCDPSVVSHFEGRVQVFNVQEVHPHGFPGGSTSATRAPAVAFFMGYVGVTFFGCEGSFEGETHHIYASDMSDSQLIVRAGGVDHRTNLQFFLQCQELAAIMALDGFFSQRSGGLLQAMVENPDTWEVVAVSANLKADLERHGPTGMYDEPYEMKAA